MSERQMEYRCGADGCTKDTPKPCGPRCHARLVAMSAEPTTEDAPTPNAVAQAREAEQAALSQLLDASNAKRDEDFAMGVYVAGTAYAKEVEARVRAECAAKVDALEEFIALECDPTQFIGAKREWLIGLHRKHFPQNYSSESQP